MGSRSYWAGVVSLAMNMGAYMSETLRGALNAVPEGQREAALTIGMTEGAADAAHRPSAGAGREIGRASCRERV